MAGRTGEAQSACAEAEQDKTQQQREEEARQREIELTQRRKQEEAELAALRVQREAQDKQDYPIIVRRMGEIAKQHYPEFCHIMAARHVNQPNFETIIDYRMRCNIPIKGDRQQRSILSGAREMMEQVVNNENAARTILPNINNRICTLLEQGFVTHSTNMEQENHIQEILLQLAKVAYLQS
jgi:multidrug efflux pump subunit AcrA (membrane-fusion protein)